VLRPVASGPQAGYNAGMRRTSLIPALTLVLGLAGAWPSTSAAQAVPAAAPSNLAPAQPAGELGVRNFTRVDASFACGGALSDGAIAQIKQAGYKSIVNLRAEGEAGANIEAEKKAARDAGLVYVWLPFVNATPEPARIDEFLKAAGDASNLPMLIHCASGGRVSMFWAVKRVMIDGWPVEKAMAELPALSGHVSPAVKAFVLDYIKQHGK
jgi:uncharacterized protein (TIGR01244 family)